MLMTENDSKLTERYGITVEHKTVYSYKGHTYENLKDALNYAKMDMGRAQEGAAPKAREKTTV